MKTPCVLLILDGWGKADPGAGNAVSLAKTPHMDRLFAEYPHTELLCMGRDVGLPDGQMGNSEVGHLNLGAGRIVYQDIMRIDLAIETGALQENDVLGELVRATKKGTGRVHLLGLLSDGGVHSHQAHLVALVEALAKQGVHDVCIHAFLDGRDTPPSSGLGYIRDLEKDLERIGVGRIATVAGRYYAMDRDHRWERVRLAYDAFLGRGPTAPSPQQAVQAAYDRGEMDEFVVPQIIAAEGEPLGAVHDGDTALFYNFRADRARELTEALTTADFTGFAREHVPHFSMFASMARYDKAFTHIPVLFPPVQLEKILGELVSAAGMTQLRAAETEKYAHVTYFFNGGVETPFPGEERKLVDSPKEVATYDQKPEMSIAQVTQYLLHGIESGAYDLVVCNFANLDMVGHTGNISATIKACEAVDTALGQILTAIQNRGASLFVTADHGNAEDMLDAEGNMKTSHSINPVPFVYVGPRKGRLRSGRLADVAPTILAVLNLEQPEAMTGECLLTFEDT